MDGFDAGIAGKVSGVEGQDLSDVMNSHSGNQASVMNLDAGNVVIDEEASPFCVYSWGLGKQTEVRFDCQGADVRVPWGKAISIAIDWPRQRVPEFSEIL